ncbi:MAG: hypothetical protein JNJ70_19890 [Verrucomicrobiales bacterium]|nr:hypothetical protein [Verrucomicrobiales bacterium]
MIDFKRFSHLGFVRPVIPGDNRSQVPAEFLGFVSAYESAENRHLTVRGTDLISVMTVLRSKPPTHCWKGDFVIKAMKDFGMGECKTKAVLSCLRKSGWIRYLRAMKGGEPIGLVIEVMFYQLPQQEAGRDRIIRINDHDRPKIFRKEGSGWVEVPDEDYPAKYISSALQVAAPLSGPVTQPVAWVPSEWGLSERVSSERVSSERAPSEWEIPLQYQKDKIEEDTIEKRPVSPLSEKGDLCFASPGKEEESGAEGVPSPGATPVADNTLSAPGAATVHSRFVSDLVMLGLQSLNSPADRLIYEEFVVDQLLPQHLADPTPPLSKWHADKGFKWLAAALVARVVLALFSDERWPKAVGRTFHRRAESLDLKKLLLGFDWSRHGSDSVTSLFASADGKSNAEGWECFIEKCKLTIRRKVEDLTYLIESLDPVGDARSAFEYWIQFNSRGGNTSVDDSSKAEDKFIWLYKTGLVEQVAFGREGTPQVRSDFEMKRAKWRVEITELAATTSNHLAVVVAFKETAHLIWGIDLREVRKVHDEWINRIRRIARIYGLKVEKTFASFFDSENSNEGGQKLGPALPLSNDPSAASTAHRPQVNRSPLASNPPAGSVPPQPSQAAFSGASNLSIGPASGPIPTPRLGPGLTPSLSQGLTPCLTPIPAPSGIPSQVKGSEDLDAASVFHLSAEDRAARYAAALRGS